MAKFWLSKSIFYVKNDPNFSTKISLKNIDQWGQRGCRDSKAWKITTEDSRVIKIVEFSFIFMFWRILFFWYNHEISYLILAPFLSEAVEASRCYVYENQEWISKIYYLRILKLLSNKILLTHFNLSLSEPIHKTSLMWDTL